MGLSRPVAGGRDVVRCRGRRGRRSRGQRVTGARRVRVGPVQVDVEPPPVALVPDAGLLALLRVCEALPEVKRK